MSALYVSAARRRQWVVAGASSACRHGQLRGWPQRMRRRRAALRGRPKGRCRDFQRAGGGGNAAPGSTPMGWKRCGLEGSPVSAGSGARRSDLRWLSLLNFGSSFATWGSQVRRPPSPPLGDPSAGPAVTRTRPTNPMYLRFQSFQAWAQRAIKAKKGCPAPAFTEGRCRPRNWIMRWRRSSPRARTAAA